MSSAAWPMQDAVVSVLEPDATMRTLTGGAGRVYGQEAPPNAFVGIDAGGTARGYIVVTGPTESPSDTFGGGGNTGRHRLHCWGATVAHAMEMYQRANALLHGVGLVVDGHAWIDGELALVGMARDPDVAAWQAIGDYRWATAVAA